MQIRIETGGDLRRVARGLSLLSNGKELRKRFVRDVGREVRPIAVKVRRAYRSSSSQNQPNPPGRGDLRPMLARATTATVRTGGRDPGVTLRVDGRKMPPRMGGVPGAWEGRKRWRHPVFGDRRKWVRQDSRPTFDRIVPAEAKKVERRVRQLADNLARDMVKGSR